MIDQNFFGELKKVMLLELAAICGFKTINERNFLISGVSVLDKATRDELSFFGNRKYINDFRKTSAGAVIITEKDVVDLPKDTVGLIYPNATIGYAKAINVLWKETPHIAHISDTAKVHETAKIGAGCKIGENVFIGEGAEIGENTCIEHNSVIGNFCKIGANGKIGNNVTISYSIIGKNAIIHSGARIGESGFGIIPMPEGTIYVPQLGRVVIGDNVRIGANTTIDRGSIEDTTVGNGTIIDNLVQIGHNVQIGERSILVAQVGIAGSTKIGNGVVLAGQVGVAGHIHIGDGVVAAAKSGIAASIEPGKIVGGIPAVDIGTWKRQASFLKTAVTRKK